MKIYELSAQVLLLNELLGVFENYRDQDLSALSARLEKFDSLRVPFIQTLTDEQKAAMTTDEAVAEARAFFTKQLLEVFDEVVTGVEESMAEIAAEGGFDDE